MCARGDSYQHDKLVVRIAELHGRIGEEGIDEQEGIEVKVTKATRHLELAHEPPVHHHSPGALDPRHLVCLRAVVVLREAACAARRGPQHGPRVSVWDSNMHCMSSRDGGWSCTDSEHTLHLPHGGALRA